MLIAIAWRNIFRQKKRSSLTAFVIAIGIIMVILFLGASSAFKKVMIGEITDSMLGHIQIHKKGYMMNVDTQPLDMTIESKAEKKLLAELKKIPEITEVAPRLKFNGMVSNYDKSVAMKVAAVSIKEESIVSPNLTQRVEGIESLYNLKNNEIIIPETIAKSMELNIGEEIVFIATNASGSVNGMSYKIAGIISLSLGPEGKTGYIRLDDAKELLRMDENIELAIRVKNIDNVKVVVEQIQGIINQSFLNKNKKPMLEVHPWQSLTNFTSTLSIINIMTLFLQLILIFIVLFSILNIMIMAVYERTKEIGTMAAIGTIPSSILQIFVWEGFFLGIISSSIGSAIGIAINTLISSMNITYHFSRNTLVLKPEVSILNIMVIILLVTLISTGASLFPAIKASKLEPVDALRS